MRERIIEIMESVFEQPITEESSIDNVEGWDSIKHMLMITRFEDEFKIVIYDSDTVNMINFKLIDIILNNYLSKNKT